MCLNTQNDYRIHLYTVVIQRPGLAAVGLYQKRVGPSSLASTQQPWLELEKPRSWQPQVPVCTHCASFSTLVSLHFENYSTTSEVNTEAPVYLAIICNSCHLLS